MTDEVAVGREPFDSAVGRSLTASYVGELAARFVDGYAE